MAQKKIEKLPLFIEAALNEFWKVNPDYYSAFLQLLGKRISEVQRGLLDEDAYTSRYICPLDEDVK